MRRTDGSGDGKKTYYLETGTETWSSVTMLNRRIFSTVLFASTLLPNAIAHAAGRTSSGMTAFSHSFTTVDGDPLPLSQFEGKAILVVNTASQCGFTDQYGPLQALHEEFSDAGLVVIGVPSGDFGGQEFDSNADIKSFVERGYKVDFPLTSKTLVSGNNAHAFYKWAGDEVGFVGRPRWNFHKYLIGRDGKVQNWFSTITQPDSPALKSAIRRALSSRV
ncbi:MAG: glutathione peroxidase [Pseudomonadota bacterium]